MVEHNHPLPLPATDDIVDTVREPLLILTGDLRVRRANRSFYQTFKVTPEETEGRLLYGLGNRQWDIPALRTLLEEILPQNSAFNDHEVAHDFEAIGHKVMLLNARRIHREGHSSEFILLAIEDITERQRAEDERRELETRFTSLVKNIKDHSIFTLDPEGRITSWNVEAERILGYTGAEVLGQHFSLIFTPEDVAQGTPAMELGTAREQGRAEDERWHLRKGGEPFWALGIVTPTQDASGKHTGYSKILRDMTDRKRAEDSLRESEERFRTLVDQVKEYAIFRMDTQGRATTWNQGVGRLLGYDAAEFVGMDLGRLFTPEDVGRGIPQQELEEAADHGSAGDDRWLVRKDGTRIWVVGSVTTVRGEAGQLVGFSKVLGDQTVRKRAEEELARLNQQLRDADRKKDEFLATLAHELRNPLAPIRTGLQVLRMTHGHGDAFHQTRDMMERQVQHLVRLIDDLLDVSRITRGKVELQRQRVGLAAVVQSALETSRPLIEAAGHELTVTLPDGAIYLYADVVRLSQVFGNLLNNAARYMGKQGRIWLAAEREESGVVVKIRDTGSGIPADMLPRIFDAFTQVDRSLERTQGGLGIGLTLVKKLVEMHGGQVEARSAGAGRGSEFIVRLPVIAERPDVPPSKEPEGERVATTKRNILVVDDNRDAAESLALLLRLSGHEVRTAHDGVEAVETAAASRPEMVFLDIGMPKLNGYDVARKIRQEPWGKGVGLIAVTGWGQDEDRRRSQAAGFDHHLTKPVDPAALESLLAADQPPKRDEGLGPK
jgi:PAS domain S-box-containing protein